MTNKYLTGTYIVTIFDRYGTKINSVLQSSGGLISAQLEGERMVREMKGCESFVVSRVLYNSLDQS